jgi:hypothetical protein
VKISGEIVNWNNKGKGTLLAYVDGDQVRFKQNIWSMSSQKFVLRIPVSLEI